MPLSIATSAVPGDVPAQRRLVVGDEKVSAETEDQILVVAG